MRNQAIKTRLRHIVRDVRGALSASDSEAAGKTFARATVALQKAVTKGVLHRNSASRKISRLARAVNRLASGKSA